jgi:glycosyltransferase involved in cell wall biosynthesis
MRIIAAHLLNDYSGSPKVLSQLLTGWTENGIETVLFTSEGKAGFLSNIKNVDYQFVSYKWVANPFMRLFNFLWSQISLCLQIIRFAQKTDIIYVNTVLPFGAAIGGKLTGCKVVYHIHETSIKPILLKKFLFGIVRLTATDVVYVSNYLAKQEPIKNVNIHILPNAIPTAFLNKATASKITKHNASNLLMVCSLKSYKGINEFVALANALPEFSLKLVLNATQQEIDNYFTDTLPNNLSIYATQTDLHTFYEWADVVLNLSIPSAWVETFGLTIIEGMAYGNPAIVPPVGGIAEVVQHNETGYHIVSTNLAALVTKIKRLNIDFEEYKRLRFNAFQKIEQFSELHFINANIKLLQLIK